MALDILIDGHDPLSANYFTGKLLPHLGIETQAANDGRSLFESDNISLVERPQLSGILIPKGYTCCYARLATPVHGENPSRMDGTEI